MGERNVLCSRSSNQNFCFSQQDHEWLLAPSHWKAGDAVFTEKCAGCAGCQTSKSIRTVIASSPPRDLQPSAPPSCISSRFQALFWVPGEHGQKLREHSGSGDQQPPTHQSQDGQMKAPKDNGMSTAGRILPSRVNVGPPVGKYHGFVLGSIFLSQVYIMLSYHLHMARSGQAAPFRPAVRCVCLLD